MNINKFFTLLTFAITLILFFVVFEMEARFDKYRLETDITIQQLEVDRQVYKEEVDKLRVDNYVMYDQLRQVQENNLFRLYLERE